MTRATPSPIHPGCSERGFPVKVDLRKELPPVADQGDIFSMSCVTFATVYYQMTHYVKHFKHPEWDLKNPEHQFSVVFAFNQGGLGDPRKVYKVLKESGCVDNAEMNYSQWNISKPTGQQFEAAKPYRISDYFPLWDHGNGHSSVHPPNSIQNAKAWLADGHVLSVIYRPELTRVSGVLRQLHPTDQILSISLTPTTFTPPDTGWRSSATTTTSILVEKTPTTGAAS